MDAFYEESAICKKSEKESKKYKIINIVFWACVIISAICLMQFILTFPWGKLTTEEDYALFSFAVFCGIQSLVFAVTAFILYKWKSHLNISYDYIFVSGELRISKVININKRKLITRIDCADILQLGDADNAGFDRLYSDPNTKKVLCTPNEEPGEGKFFMYVLVGNNGKVLFVLECRELLLMNILKFVRRGVLESDYVMQEKKQK